MSQNLIDDLRYRHDIDGLRAIAVGLVLLFHADFGCSGGYIGVDVFFVISGFLITSLIWRDLESGRFTFANFWERRMRRIAPALIVLTLATVIAGWFLLLPTDFENLGQATASQAVFAANFHYWRNSGYFTGAADEKPLLQTWSLAVEEQFYLIAPFFFWAIFQLPFFRRRTTLCWTLILALAISLGASIYGVEHHPWAAFYLLPTRAWELLLGSLIAFIPTNFLITKRRSLCEIASLVGLTLILVPAFAYTKLTPFPGLSALPPCGGTALLIWANGSPDGKPYTLIGRTLSLRPIVFIGTISYSLYLWHWPFLAYARYLALLPLSYTDRAIALALGFVFAILSWRFIETPFRTRQLGTSRKAMFAYAGTGLATVFVSGLVCLVAHGFPHRFDAHIREMASAREDKGYLINLNAKDIAAGKLIKLGATDPSLSPQILVWGDSHAMSALPAFDQLLKKKGIAGRAATHQGTAPIINWHKSTAGSRTETIEYNDSVMTYIEQNHIPHVILVGYWLSYGDARGHYSEDFNHALVATVRRLVEAGSCPWILMDVPIHRFDIPKALTNRAISAGDIATLSTKPSPTNVLDGIDQRIIDQIEAAGGRILDPKPRFLDPSGQRYLVQSEGVVLYRDGGHLTVKGARQVLVPFLQDSLISEMP